jgi:SpoVK/Ycf46/Vps4 family AAA+-type ATPase
LVVPAKAATQLKEAVLRLTHQARVLGEWHMLEQARASAGARVLLTGPPGTGKSLAAEVVASAVRTDLLRVDTSQVVSKWIGETEKNLAAAFDVAERTQAVLFMDEADAIFGARTEVTDAHDRYANLETAYLLQRLDRFDGLLVLATNLRGNIDAAFLRRMDFVIDLPMPDVESRRRLWGLHLPTDRLDTTVDLDCLVHMYPIPGAWIRNAAIASAFRAAAGECAISQDDLIVSIRREYEKSALPFPGVPPRRRNDI